MSPKYVCIVVYKWHWAKTEARRITLFGETTDEILDRAIGNCPRFCYIDRIWPMVRVSSTVEGGNDATE